MVEIEIEEESRKVMKKMIWKGDVMEEKFGGWLVISRRERERRLGNVWVLDDFYREWKNIVVLGEMIILFVV